MNNTCKRILSFALALVMTASLMLTGFPAPAAHAETVSGDESPLTATLTCNTYAADGECAYTLEVKAGDNGIDGLTISGEAAGGFSYYDNSNGKYTITGTGGPLTELSFEYDGITFTFGDGGGDAAIPAASTTRTEVTANLNDNADAGVLFVGDTKDLTLTPAYATGVRGKVTWSTEDSNISVDETSGKVSVQSGASAGSADITATLKGTGDTTYATAKYTVTVKEPTISGFTASGISAGTYNAESFKTTPNLVLTFEFQGEGVYLLTKDYEAKANLQGTNLPTGTPDGDKGTLTYTFTKDNNGTFAFDNGEGNTITFTIDTEAPKGTLTVKQNEDGSFTATVSEVSNDIAAVYIAFGTQAPTSWEESDKITAADGVYTKSGTLNSGDKVYYKLVDQAGNPFEDNVEILIASVKDADNLSVNNKETTYYFNENNKDQAKLPVTISSLPSGAEIGNHLIKKDSSAPDKYYIEPLENDGDTLKPADLDGATLSYDVVTTNVKSTVEYTYILDTKAPEVKFTVDGDWLLFSADNGVAIFQDGKLENGSIPVTITVTAHDDVMLDTDTLPNSTEWTKNEAGDYVRTITENVTITDGKGTIDLSAYKTVADLSGNEVTDTEDGTWATVTDKKDTAKKLTKEALNVQTTFPQKPVKAEVKPVSQLNATGFYTNDIAFKVAIDDTNNPKVFDPSWISFEYTEGGNYMDLPVGSSVTANPDGTYTVILAIDGIESNLVRLQANIEQEMTLDDGTKLPPVVFPYTNDSDLKVDGVDPVIESIEWDVDLADIYTDGSGNKWVQAQNGLEFTVTVTETNFAKANSSVTDSNGTLTTVNDWEKTAEPNTWTWKGRTSSNEGEHVIIVSCTDEAGRAAMTQELSKTIWIDNTAPDFSLPVPTPFYQDADGNPLYNSNVEYKFTVTDLPIPDNSGITDPCVTASTDKEDEGVSVSVTGPNASGEYTVTISIPDNTEVNDITLTVTAKDNVGNSNKQTTKLSIDKKNPNIGVTWSGVSDDETKGPEGYYDHVISATVTVTDLNFDSATIQVLDTEGNDVTGKVSLSSDWTQDGISYSKTVSFDADSDNGYQLVVSATDKVGHKGLFEAAEGYTSEVFHIDLTDPKIEVSWTENGNQNPIPAPAKDPTDFYNQEITATIKVTEHNFNPDKEYTVVSGWVTDAGTFTGWTVDKNDPDVYWATVTFTNAKDAHHLSISVTDKAGRTYNGDEGYTSDSFYVDTVYPVIEVIFGDEPVNEKYFDSARTATITVTDEHFDADGVKFPEGGAVLLNEKNETWTDNGDGSYTATYVYEKDGEYQFTISVTDKADNTTNEQSNTRFSCEDKWDEFIIDTANPQVEVSLTGNIEAIFQSPVYGKDADGNDIEADYGTDSNAYEGVWFVKVKPVTPDNEEEANAKDAKPEEVTLSIQVKDANIATAENIPTTASGAYEDGTVISGWVTVNGGEKEAFTGKVEDGKVTFTKELELPPQKTVQVKYSLFVSDLAGNKPQMTETHTDVTVKAPKDATFDVDLAEDGTLSNTFSFDRRQPTSGDAFELPDISFVTEAEPFGQLADDNKLYDDDVTYTVKVTDGALDGTNSGLKSVTWQVLNGGKVLNEQQTSGEFSGTAEKKEGSLTIQPDDADNEANGILLIVTAEDYVGNKIMRQQILSIDKTAPRIDIAYENNNSVKNNGYYNASRTATITIDDLNLSSATAAVTVNTGNGSAYTLADFKAQANGTYQLSIPFNGPDVDYTLSVEATDLAGHTTTASAQEQTEDRVTTRGSDPYAFTVDTVPPVIAVTYDNDAFLNGWYYNDWRTATVSITERNFSTANGAPDFTYNGTASLAGAGITVPQPGGWGGAGDVHTTSIPFVEDGDYQFTVDFTDLAGNNAIEYNSGLFTVDTTAPTVEISNVEDHSANRGVVAPVVSFEDINFDANGYDVQITKIVNLTDDELVEWPYSLSLFDNGAELNYENLASVLENDGIYTIYATITDLAGNRSEATVTFSLNRKGSTYYAYDDPTKDLLRNIYSNQAPTLKIAEVNPNTLTEYSVTVSVNNSNTVLVENTDYTVEHDGGPDSFNQYIYTVNSSTFLRDNALAEGAYTLVFDSTDTAGNINSNRANENSLEVNFTLDATPPVISIIGIADGDRLQEEFRNVTVMFQDGYALSSVEILLNGESYKVLEGEELAEANGEYSFDIQESTRTQTLSVRAHDAAGNEAETEPISFLITSNWFVVHMAELIIAAVAALLLLFILIILIRRKKKDKSEAAA